MKSSVIYVWTHGSIGLGEDGPTPADRSLAALRPIPGLSVVRPGDANETALAAKGAAAQRPLWASTGVKNPEYSDTLYVSELVVGDTLNPMPEKTLLAFADHGELHAGGDAVTGTALEAQEVFDAVAAWESTSPMCS